MSQAQNGGAGQLSLPSGWGRQAVFTTLRITLVVLLATLIIAGPGLGALLAQLWLPLIGIGGATVANATGIGGGIVFVPAFDRLGLAEPDIVGTSLIIQSFGMSMGALTYLGRRRKRTHRDAMGDRSYVLICGLTVIPAVICAWLATSGGIRPDLPLVLLFKAISLALVVLIIGSEFLPKPDAKARRVTWTRDALSLVPIGAVGGLFVGWISIGVGELLAVYLLLRGARASDAIGLAVIVTALTVVTLMLTTGFQLPADIATGLLVAPGALIGGFLAPYLLSMVGQARVKWLCAGFIVLSAIVA